jgi:hypothetical protein
MGMVVTAGWAVVHARTHDVIAMCRTKTAAVRRLRRERAAGTDARLAELVFSSGLLETE